MGMRPAVSWQALALKGFCVAELLLHMQSVHNLKLVAHNIFIIKIVSRED